MSSPMGSTNVDEPFRGDRYERLGRGAAVLAADPALLSAPLPFNREGLGALVASIASRRLFDHLSEQHANMVTALVLMDFHCGTAEVAARIHRLLDELAVDEPPTYDALAVISGVAAVLALMTDTAAWLPAAAGEGNRG